MAALSFKSLSETYADLKAIILARAPLASSELGEVIDDIIFSFSDQLNEARIEMMNALQLVKLESTSGTDLDNVAADYPNLKPRFSATNGTGLGTVTDPAITKISNQIAAGGGNSGDTFLNAVSTASFPAAGTILVGTRGQVNFETISYSSKTSTQFILSAPLAFSHASAEPIVKVTVGDRIFPGPFTLSTKATAQTAAKTYTSTSSLVIYDGEENGTMNIQATSVGPSGNTPAGTIRTFIGIPPFPGALVNNTASITNAIAREEDPDLRQRIRRQRQALSSANIDAVYSSLLGTSFQGQTVVFAQLVEDPNPTLPSIIYVDDGGAFVATQASISTPIVLKDVAAGGEDIFYIPTDKRPMVVSTVENASRVFANITIQKNGTTLSQGDGASQYRVQPDSGLIKINTALSSGDSLEITALTYYTGLMSEATNVIYGKRDDRVNYPGSVGLGQWVQLRTPATQFVSITGTIKLDGTRSKADVIVEIQQKHIEYVNGLGIGATVIKNRLIDLGFVKGVRDFNLITPSADIVIGNGVLSRTTLGNINLS